MSRFALARGTKLAAQSGVVADVPYECRSD